MSARVDNYARLAPASIRAMMALEASFQAVGFEPLLLELVKLRASQINGCAFCIHMHSTALRQHGCSEMRLYLLPAWRESSLYSERERAALAWTEALTLLPQTGAPDADFAPLRALFSEAEIVHLTLAIGSINTWNRLAVGLRAVHPVDAPAHAA